VEIAETQEIMLAEAAAVRVQLGRQHNKVQALTDRAVQVAQV
jgi:hypothetical protein